jgi:hypothetical protein
MRTSAPTGRCPLLSWARPRTSARRWFPLGCVLLLGSALGGCAAVSNPVGDAIPVRRLPPEVFGPSKDDEKRVPLTLLRQKPPEVYKLGPGDTLGVFIEGVLGEAKVPPPVKFPEQGNLPPAIGYPLPVREDGTVPLPFIKAVKVSGLSLVEAQAAIVKAYSVTKQVIKENEVRVIVTLIRPRQYRVLVLREDAGGTTTGATGGFGGFNTAGTFFTETRRASGFALDLPAYENDVLTALTRSGGLPGVDAENEVIIERGGMGQGADGKPAAPGSPESATDADAALRRLQKGGGQTLRIPLRVKPDQKINVRPEDVILGTGDIIYVPFRRGEIFYTGGLLPARIFPLPRDRDLNVLQAMALVGAPLINGNFNASNLSGSLVQSGIGFPSPSLLVVLRTTASGGQIPIRVDLNRALRDPRERILIQPGDFLVLQETLDESITRYIDTNFRFLINYEFLHSRYATGTLNANLP